MRRSIRGRLLLWQISALALTGLLASLITYSLAWDGFNRLRDYSLEQIAYSILRHGVVYESDGGEAVSEDQGQFVSQIWNADGSLAYSSLEDGGPPQQRNGLNTVRWGGEEWHLFTVRDGGLTIQVGNPSARRSHLFASIIPWLLLPMSLLLVLLGSFIWLSVGRALAPLERVRAEISQRDVPSLGALDMRGLPDEIEPVVGALNELLGRLDAALSLQRRFIADAAHELRTPLTAVRLQAQIARQAGTPDDRDAALAQLLAGVDRATHLVQQLLDMARLAPEANGGARLPVALDELTKRVVADFSSQAESRDIDLGAGACARLTIPGQAEDLRVMLGNLVDNALRYTPPGGRVDVELNEADGAAVLTVADNGPGIPMAERERVFDRFHRLAGADNPGSGLGLAIVRAIVDRQRGRVVLLDTPGGGLTVRVELPLKGPGAEPAPG